MSQVNYKKNGFRIVSEAKEDKEENHIKRREHPRFNVGVKVAYSIISDPAVTPYMYGSTETLNISEGGMSISIDYKVQVPIMIQLNIQAPQAKYPLSVLGKIIWCRQDTFNKYIVGIKFIGALPKDWKTIIQNTVGAASKSQKK